MGLRRKAAQDLRKLVTSKAQAKRRPQASIAQTRVLDFVSLRKILFPTPTGLGTLHPHCVNGSKIMTTKGRSSLLCDPVDPSQVADRKNQSHNKLPSRTPDSK